MVNDSFLIISEHFMVWMRESPTPKATKLYGILESPLKSGKYFIEFKEFPAKSVKWVTIVNKNKIGEKNADLVGACFGIACLSWILAILIFKRKI